jgi:hypothetical protein
MFIHLNFFLIFKEFDTLKPDINMLPVYLSSHPKFTYLFTLFCIFNESCLLLQQNIQPLISNASFWLIEVFFDILARSFGLFVFFHTAKRQERDKRLRTSVCLTYVRLFFEVDTAGYFLSILWKPKQKPTSAAEGCAPAIVTIHRTRNPIIVQWSLRFKIIRHTGAE